MPRPRLIRPRKLPKQERARATVEAILEATARILVREGFAAASTNRIAERAGVSVGSLYQYFPNKHAIVATLLDRHVGEMHRAVEERLRRGAAQPLRAEIRDLVRGMLDAHAVEPELHRVFHEEMPRGGRIPATGVDADLEAMVRRYLERGGRRPPDRSPEIAAFVVVEAIEALTHAAVLHRPVLLRSGAFVDEVTELLAGYLERASRARRARRDRMGAP